jgi:hypothetical protein
LWKAFALLALPAYAGPPDAAEWTNPVWMLVGVLLIGVIFAVVGTNLYFKFTKNRPVGYVRTLSEEHGVTLGMGLQVTGFFLLFATVPTMFANKVQYDKRHIYINAGWVWQPTVCDVGYSDLDFIVVHDREKQKADSSGNMESCLFIKKKNDPSEIGFQFNDILTLEVAKTLIDRVREYNANKLIESINNVGVESNDTLEYLRQTLRFPGDQLPQLVQMIRDKLTAAGLRETCWLTHVQSNGVDDLSLRSSDGRGCSLTLK